MAVIPGSKILLDDLGGLAALANSKTTLPGKPYSFTDWPDDARPEGTFWLPNNDYPRGFVITDTNGNDQQVTTAGTSGGSSIITWATVIGNTTTEGTVTWTRIANKNPRWLKELNRLRGQLLPVVAAAVATNGGIYPWQQKSISGGAATADKVAGWPLSSPNVNNKNLAFWYADTGSSEHVSISQASGPVQSSGVFTTQTANTLKVTSGGGYVWVAETAAFINKKSFSILIGGASPVTVQGDFLIPFALVRGATYTPSTAVADTGAVPVPTVDVSSWISSSTTTIWTPTWAQYAVFGGPNSNVCGYVLLRVNGTVAPGRYTVVVNMPCPDDVDYGTSALVQSRILLASEYGSNTWSMYAVGYNTFNPTTSYGTGYPTVTGSTLGPGVSANGISNSANVLKIDCSTWCDTAPFGIISLYQVESDYYAPGTFSYGVPFWINHPTQPYIPNCEIWRISPFPQPTFSGEKSIAMSCSITSTTPGYWTGNSDAVSSLNTPALNKLPWNLLRTKKRSTGYTYFSENPMLLGNLHPSTLDPSNSYDNTLPVESQLEPPAWKASTYFSVGFRIMTRYNYIVEVTTAGTSGATYPGFGATVGATSTDGSVVWTVRTNPRLPADTWAAATAYPLGATVYDFNGNQQTSVDSWFPNAALSLGKVIIDRNGNAQQVTTAGTTGSSQPTWATTAGASTTDGTVSWICGGAAPRTSDPTSEPTWNTFLNGYTTDALVTWKLTTPNRKWWTPAVHRPVGVPRYPVYWYSETIARLKPPTTSAESEKTIWGCGNQWQQNSYVIAGSPFIAHDAGWQQDNLAKGWWIYSVSLNRMLDSVKTRLPVGAGDGGIGAGDSGMDTSGASGSEVNVTIGCMRSGSFVAFGTYPTGTTVQVLWPIFTSDALVYQCAERVDIQAVAIASGGAGVSVGATVSGYPICAAFVSDTEQLLNLIP